MVARIRVTLGLGAAVAVLATGLTLLGLLLITSGMIMDSIARARLEAHRDLITGLARLSSAEDADAEAPDGAVQDVLDEATIILPIADVIDMAGEKARLEKEMAKLEEAITIMRAELIASIKPPLSKEQIAKLKQPPRRPQGRPQQARPQQGRPSPDRPQRPPAERKSLDELIKRGDSGGGDRPPRDRVPQRPPRDSKPEK